MKTVITEEIDGLNIVLGFGDPAIDRFETEKMVKPLIESSADMAQVKSISQQIGTKQQENANARANLKNPEILQYQTLVQKNQRVLSENLEFMNVKERELAEVSGRIKADKIRLMNEQAVFQEPKKGEFIHEENAEFESLVSQFEGIKGNHDKKLKVDSPGDSVLNPEIIDDLRNKKYHVKNGTAWEIKEKLKLGEPAPSEGFLPENLSAEQSEEIHEQADVKRISELSVEDKTEEYNAHVENAAQQAASKRSKLEIQGTTPADALAESQVFYGAEVEKLNLKYGVTP